MKKNSGLLKNFAFLFVGIFSTISFGQKVPEDILKNMTYRNIGPTRQSGRFSDVAVVEKNPKIFYAATGSGGLLKTENHGQSFSFIFDNENVISIGDIEISQNNPNIVWVGTGEGNASRSMYWGDGVYKSVDAGKTWENMGLKETQHISRIIIHPKNDNIVYVAAMGKLYSANPERGIYKTTDGGKSWTKSLELVIDGRYIAAADIVIDPKNPEILYASTYDFERKPWTFNPGGPGSGIYKTTNGGKNWTKLEKGLPTGMIGRIGLAIYPKNTDILYANIENNNIEGVSDKDRWEQIKNNIPKEGEIGSQVYRSDDGGESWYLTHPLKRKNERTGKDHYVTVGGAPGYYYNDIRIDPNNSERIYVLSTALHFSEDGGKTWRNSILQGGDNHAMWINPNDSDHIILGYDHGIKITFDGGKTSHHPDNLPIGQFYAVGVDMDFPYNVYGGTQDNGSLKGPSTKKNYGAIRFEDWQSVGGGDGFFNEVDYTDSRWLYTESQFGAISRRDQVIGQSISIRPRIPELDEKGAPKFNNGQPIYKTLRYPWRAPIQISNYDPKTIYHCSQYVARSRNRGESWELISPDLTTNDPKKYPSLGNITHCAITAFDESPIERGVMWVGTDDGNVWITKDDGKNWENLNSNIPNNPNYWVIKVEASHHYPGTAYIAFWGYKYDDEKPWIYKTTDYGKSWKYIGTNAPFGAVHVIREDHKNPNLLFIGNTFGVSASIDAGENWFSFRNNMPNNPIHDLVIHPRENDLVVGTHGRSIWVTDITPLQELNNNILQSNAHLFDIEYRVKWRPNINMNSSSANFNGESEPKGVIVNYYLKNPTKEVLLSVYQNDRLINEIRLKDVKSGINKAIWNYSILSIKQIEEARNNSKDQQSAQSSQFSFTGSTHEALPGQYKISLTVDGKLVNTKSVQILEDVWTAK